MMFLLLILFWYCSFEHWNDNENDNDNDNENRNIDDNMIPDLCARLVNVEDKIEVLEWVFYSIPPIIIIIILVVIFVCDHLWIFMIESLDIATTTTIITTNNTNNINNINNVDNIDNDVVSVIII